ncbi:MAG: hypothetical protein EOO06_00240 [Chitinophagaceae bacterium]|nr:MAG: hypothetical protein EOO06_00240 [Chitinophagaceae bacterium]
MIERHKQGKELLPFSNTIDYLVQIRIQTYIITKAVEHFSKSDHTLIKDLNFVDDVNAIIDSEYDSLYKSTVITVFTLLEATVKDLIVSLIKSLPTEYLSNIKEINSIKIPLFEYDSLNEFDRLQLVYNVYENSVKNGSLYGYARFDALLKPFGLTKFDKKKDKVNINELAQVRNCLVHNNGIVDRKLLTTCEWLTKTYKVGDYIKINNDTLSTYVTSTSRYLSSLEEQVLELLRKNDLLDEYDNPIL